MSHREARSPSSPAGMREPPTVSARRYRRIPRRSWGARHSQRWFRAMRHRTLRASPAVPARRRGVGVEVSVMSSASIATLDQQLALPKPGYPWSYEAMEEQESVLDATLEQIGPRLQSLRRFGRGADARRGRHGHRDLEEHCSPRLETGQRRPSLELLLPPRADVSGLPRRPRRCSRDRRSARTTTPATRQTVGPVVALTRQPGERHAWKIIVPREASEPKLTAHEGSSWMYRAHRRNPAHRWRPRRDARPRERSRSSTPERRTGSAPDGEQDAEILTIFGADGEPGPRSADLATRHLRRGSRSARGGALTSAAVSLDDPDRFSSRGMSVRSGSGRAVPPTTHGRSSEAARRLSASASGVTRPTGIEPSTDAGPPRRRGRATRYRARSRNPASGELRRVRRPGTGRSRCREHSRPRPGAPLP